VLFRGDAVAGRAALQDGQKVILKGELTVYEPRGQYQLHVLAVELQGVGALQAAFEKLKESWPPKAFSPGTKASPAAFSAAHRIGHFAHRRGIARRSARACNGAIRPGNHFRAVRRARRRRGRGNRRRHRAAQSMVAIRAGSWI
jgi:hypothetical protein